MKESIVMKLQEINLQDLYLWADKTAYEDGSAITSLIGFGTERILQMFKSVHLAQPYETLDGLSEFIHKPNWDRLPNDEREFKKLLKAFSQYKLIELFFELGRLQGIQEGWRAIVNK